MPPTGYVSFPINFVGENSAPATTFTRISGKNATRYEINRDIGPAQLKRAADFLDPSLPMTGAQPNTLRLVLLASDNQLPFRAANFARTTKSNLWEFDTSPFTKLNLPRTMSNIGIVVKPNGNSQDFGSIRYRLTRIADNDLKDEAG